MVKITVIAKDDIENVSSAEVQAILREAGISAERVRVHRISANQYEQAMT